MLEIEESLGMMAEARDDVEKLKKVLKEAKAKRTKEKSELGDV